MLDRILKFFSGLKKMKIQKIYLNQFLKLAFDVFQSANIFPGDVWSFNNGFTESGWRILAECKLEIEESNR